MMWKFQGINLVSLYQVFPRGIYQDGINVLKIGFLKTFENFEIEEVEVFSFCCGNVFRICCIN